MNRPTGLIAIALALGLAQITWANELTNLPQPPELATQSTYLTNEEVLFLPTDTGTAWAFFRAKPITDYLEPTDRIPAIESVEVLKEPWGEPGSVRRVSLDGGGAVLERVLTSTDTEFTYRIWDVQTGSGRFINHIYGEFHVRPVNDGAEIVWRYNIAPNAFFARPFIRRFLNNDFEPFMEGGLAGLDAAFQAQQ
ncbi:SRPBCC family protein [uncultured Tateyamaria sp.]|uniref:SRPBCC family protein n=1 Tax=Tateyamaria sp. 1078 TaxID=3417464 RepID=UPI00262F924B|nr:SRPBCC family protein [uncultured Tateyamaria sp.]